ncbi:ferritin-like domain-containing protein [Deinococcus metallilatus]|uniref:Ferritin-like domain-containing protein n=1 Tax=Deinococcus metallilatus TaxID=1211322 RepID=A0AAJ5F2T2_9DEIO|nr:ferritin-like domain-containing protein [Deinococcus metallilatus]MBB5295087.1 ferritin-like metal-binding protein YciE [Deinococcus metallilatus]QBY08734.1 ferritin-like domain-containing protein [Deinococcus metallilatus]RXJ10613.1 ferritin-like domain-containing protein [Deinococcus metallilatus]TLK26584.1 ferritin-like domain-containing protein [Deinococcus metallilatus]GMA14859.1 YciE/YciF family protein [Deinococcus metallilatus]
MTQSGSGQSSGQSSGGMSMKMTDLQDLYVEQLQDVYSAEQQLTQALQQMAQAASDPQLSQAFQMHLQQTQEHTQRLQQIFQDLGQQPGGKTCKAMQGIVAEGQETIKEKATPAVRDAALIAAAQRAEHYEISAYGTLRTYAEILGRQQDVDLLRTTEDEEKSTDQKLTGLARGINMEAMNQ